MNGIPQLSGKPTSTRSKRSFERLPVLLALTKIKHLSKTMKTSEITSQLNDLGFSLEVLGNPIGQVKDNWPNIHFSIRLMFRGKIVLESPYSLGIGHVQPGKYRTGSLNLHGWTANEESLLMTWQSKPNANFKDKQLQADVAAKLARIQKVSPQLEDVVSSLFPDGSPFFNAESFEDWAANFGYDTDSIKARDIYQTCMETGRKLSASIPKEVLSQAQEIVSEL